MSKFIACIFLFVASFAWAADTKPFEDATKIAYEILGTVIESPICQPTPVPDARKQSLVEALSRVNSLGLSEPTGLTPLDYAVIADDVPSIERLIALGYPLTVHDIHGGTLLQLAAHIGSKQALVFLLAHGADPNVTNSNGGTALMVAVSQNRPDFSHTLLSAGASATARTGDGGTALHYALVCRDKDLVRKLLAAGAERDARAQRLATKFGIDLASPER